MFNKSIFKPSILNKSTKFSFFTNNKLFRTNAFPSSSSSFVFKNINKILKTNFNNFSFLKQSKRNFTIIDVSSTVNSASSLDNFQNQNSSDLKKFVSLNVNNLKGNPGSKKLKRRVGRGPGSSKGKTSARGHRIRGNPYRHFEGGQTNVFRRLPKHGFRTKIFKDEFAYINIQKILYLIYKGRIDPAKPIGVKEIFYAGGVGKVVDGIKLLSRGADNLKHFPKLDLIVQSATEKAIHAIKECGGSITVSHGTRLYNRYLLKPAKFTKQLVEPYPSFKRVKRMLRLKDKGAA
jgi:large subunit ribosomal protein L15